MKSVSSMKNTELETGKKGRCHSCWIHPHDAGEDEAGLIGRRGTPIIIWIVKHSEAGEKGPRLISISVT